MLTGGSAQKEIRELLQTTPFYVENPEVAEAVKKFVKEQSSISGKELKELLQEAKKKELALDPHLRNLPHVKTSALKEGVYQIQKKRRKTKPYELIDTEDRVVGKHDTWEAAKRQERAIHARKWAKKRVG